MHRQPCISKWLIVNSETEASDSMRPRPVFQFNCGFMPTGMRLLAAAMFLAHSFGGCPSADGQTAILYSTGLGQSQMQSASAITGSSNVPKPQGSSIASKSAQIASGISSISGAKNSLFKQKISHALGMNSLAPSSSFCFQPGVGWQRSSTADTVASAFQTIPVSLMTLAVKAQKSSETADADECAASDSSADASSESLATANRQFGSSASFSSPGATKVQDTPSGLLLQSNSNGTSFSFSNAPASANLSIMASISQTGDAVFSLVSPEGNSGTVDASAQNPTVGVSVFSFSPGRGASSNSASGRESNQVKWSAIENERSRMIGHETDELKSQEAKASTEKPISFEDLHAYRQLRFLCLKVVEAQQAGNISDSLTAALSGGRKATELARMREDCGQFLVMGRDSVIRKMQRHNGLK